ncbi:hypothetical protein F5876DRAFT_79725 [Lentinula aff. lateritia]|uniref:Uncharacterized protein n=1 Tax=Lentinula aff. lateritia TaxID=2804960 RepID=A0ACC1TSE7_9AGAR|nr:hypothetical protein F5876DRAFT_79725 [Lentinula aff. lateritia]
MTRVPFDERLHPGMALSIDPELAGRPGDIVPLVRTVQAIQTYDLPHNDGYRWSLLILTSLEDDIGVTQQLGEILTKLKLDLPSDDVVDNHIITRLKNVLESGMPDVEDALILHSRIENLLSRAHNLKKLPSTLCHIDINPFNVIIDYSTPPRIKGLLPYGINAYQIRLIARKRVDYPESETAVAIVMTLWMAFWKTFTDGITSPELKAAILDSMSIGLILFPHFFEGTGISKAEQIQDVVARLNWLEEMYRPLCT